MCRFSIYHGEKFNEVFDFKEIGKEGHFIRSDGINDRFDADSGHFLDNIKRICIASE